MNESPPPSRFDWPLAVYWTLVYSVNLCVPVLFGIASVPESAYPGMALGVVVIYAAGVLLCGYRFRSGRSLLWGGSMIAVTQVVPLHYFLVGGTALELWAGVSGVNLRHFSDGREPPEPSMVPICCLGTFVVTLLTAQPFLLAAFLLGALTRWLAGDRPIWRNEPKREEAAGE